MKELCNYNAVESLVAIIEECVYHAVELCDKTPDRLVTLAIISSALRRLDSSVQSLFTEPSIPDYE